MKFSLFCSTLFVYFVYVKIGNILPSKFFSNEFLLLKVHQEVVTEMGHQMDEVLVSETSSEVVCRLLETTAPQGIRDLVHGTAKHVNRDLVCMGARQGKYPSLLCVELKPTLVK